MDMTLTSFPAPPAILERDLRPRPGGGTLTTLDPGWRVCAHNDYLRSEDPACVVVVAELGSFPLALERGP